MSEPLQPRTTWSTDELQHEAYARDEVIYDRLSTAIRDEVIEEWIWDKPRALLVEIGSGMGRAMRLSRYATQVRQTDRNPDVVAARQKLGENVMACAASELSQHFAEDSVDLIVGTNVLDTVAPQDLDSELSGIKRVLKPKGRLIHFLDLNAFHETVFASLLSRGFLPCAARVEDMMGVFAWDLDHARVVLAETMGEYVEAPARFITQLMRERPHELASVCQQLQRAYTIAEGTEPDIRELNDLFNESLIAAIHRSGMTVIKHGYQSLLEDFDLTPTSPPLARTSGCNYFVSRHGTTRALTDGTVTEQMYRVYVDVLVLVAQKL